MKLLPGRKACRAGDVVALKSGSPTMTVNWAGAVVFAPGRWTICQWFDDAGELRQEMFCETMLERVTSALAA
jgi:uncharacterized protein YodC (DUF2158 family)